MAIYIIFGCGNNTQLKEVSDTEDSSFYRLQAYERLRMKWITFLRRPKRKLWKEVNFNIRHRPFLRILFRERFEGIVIYQVFNGFYSYIGVEAGALKIYWKWSLYHTTIILLIILYSTTIFLFFLFDIRWLARATVLKYFSDNKKSKILEKVRVH